MGIVSVVVFVIKLENKTWWWTCSTGFWAGPCSGRRFRAGPHVDPFSTARMHRYAYKLVCSPSLHPIRFLLSINEVSMKLPGHGGSHLHCLLPDQGMRWPSDTKVGHCFNTVHDTEVTHCFDTRLGGGGEAWGSNGRARGSDEELACWARGCAGEVSRRLWWLCVTGRGFDLKWGWLICDRNREKWRDSNWNCLFSFLLIFTFKC